MARWATAHAATRTSVIPPGPSVCMTGPVTRRQTGRQRATRGAGGVLNGTLGHLRSVSFFFPPLLFWFFLFFRGHIGLKMALYVQLRPLGSYLTDSWGVGSNRCFSHINLLCVYVCVCVMKFPQSTWIRSRPSLLILSRYLLYDS